MICTISAPTLTLLIFHPTKPIWTCNHKLALRWGISPHDASVFHSAWKVTLIWAHIYCLCSSPFGQAQFITGRTKNGTYPEGLRAGWRFQFQCVCYATITARCVNFWKTSSTFSWLFFWIIFVSCGWIWTHLSSSSVQMLAVKEEAHGAEEATLTLSEAPCPYLEA